MRHKHADLIHAWAEGAEIEARGFGGCWRSVTQEQCITWSPDVEYRIKPQPKPDVVRYVETGVGNDYFRAVCIREVFSSSANLKLTFDGDDPTKLKSAEVLK